MLFTGHLNLLHRGSHGGLVMRKNRRRNSTAARRINMQMMMMMMIHMIHMVKVILVFHIHMRYDHFFHHHYLHHHYLHHHYLHHHYHHPCRRCRDLLRLVKMVVDSCKSDFISCVCGNPHMWRAFRKFDHLEAKYRGFPEVVQSTPPFTLHYPGHDGDALNGQKETVTVSRDENDYNVHFTNGERAIFVLVVTDMQNREATGKIIKDGQRIPVRLSWPVIS